MIDGVSRLFTDFTNATVAVGKIDELESEADLAENMLIEHIFSSDMDGFNKILLRDLVQHIAAISDRAENVGDRIRLIVAKRSI
jgi:predicted phosphate transport protein (TIGR00153 family)